MSCSEEPRIVSNKILKTNTKFNFRCVILKKKLDLVLNKYYVVVDINYWVTASCECQFAPSPVRRVVGEIISGGEDNQWWGG